MYCWCIVDVLLMLLLNSQNYKLGLLICQLGGLIPQNVWRLKKIQLISNKKISNWNLLTPCQDVTISTTHSRKVMTIISALFSLSICVKTPLPFWTGGLFWLWESSHLSSANGRLVGGQTSELNHLGYSSSYSQTSRHLRNTKTESSYWQKEIAEFHRLTQIRICNLFVPRVLYPLRFPLLNRNIMIPTGEKIKFESWHLTSRQGIFDHLLVRRLLNILTISKRSCLVIMSKCALFLCGITT